MTRNKRNRREHPGRRLKALAAWTAVALAAACLTGCSPAAEQPAAETAAPQETAPQETGLQEAAPGESIPAEDASQENGLPGVQVTVDGEILAAPAGGEKAPGLWVTVMADGAVAAELPFAEKHTVRIEQDGIGENTVILTGKAVYMQDADCPGKDCVSMGEVTQENLEMRVLGGFIICLPHRLSVEVWEKK